MMPELHELRLDNGFRALLVERRGLPLVATVLWYGVGSRDERSGESGLAHFLEHMMFKGTDRYAKGEIDALTAKLGGSNNAFTDHDGTAYHFALAADRWETAIEIEANRMVGCAFDPREFEAEKSVVLDELARGEDDPWSVLWHATEALAFEVHPYHRPVIGYREDLQRSTVERMRAFYGRHYGPNRSFLVVVGDFARRQAEKRIRAAFGGLPPVPEREPVLAEPDTTAERRGVVRAPGTLTRIAMACRTCRIGDRGDFALDVLSHVLGSGRSSRLHKRLVLDEEIATTVSTHNEPRLDPGLFWVLAELHPGQDPARAEALVRDELDKLCADGVTAAELKRARVQIRSSFLFEEETALDTALKIGRFEALAPEGHRLLARVLSIYDDLDRRELRDVAGRLFAPARWTVVWSLPEGAPVPRPSIERRRPATRRSTTGTKARPAAAVAEPAVAKPARGRTRAEQPPKRKAAKKRPKRAARPKTEARGTKGSARRGAAEAPVRPTPDDAGGSPGKAAPR